MDDGTVVLVEMFGPRITRVHPDGTKETVAEIAGGPNGLAVGPDGAFYLCNNGGCFAPIEVGGMLFPGAFDPDRYIGGRIQRVDPATGEVTDLYTECDGHPLRAPNDIVFDAHGGMYFTDHGIRARAHERSHRHLLRPARRVEDHARWPSRRRRRTASACRRTATPCTGPRPTPVGCTNVASSSRACSRRRRRSTPSVCLCGLPGLQLLDSLGVDGAGNVCVATLINGGVTVIAPSGEILEHVATGDPMTTNVCFTTDDPSTAFITWSAFGKLVSTSWGYGVWRSATTPDPIGPLERGLTGWSAAGSLVGRGAALPSRDPRLPQEPGRLRQARRHPARRRHGRHRRRVGRRPRRRQHLRLHRGRPPGVDRHDPRPRRPAQARRPPGGHRLHGGALRRRARRRPARRSTRSPASGCRSTPPPSPRQRRRWRSDASRRRPSCRASTCSTSPARSRPCRGPTSRSPRAATAPAGSARSPRSGARSAAVTSTRS